MNVSKQQGQSQSKYSASQKKLMRITHQIPFNISSTQMIEDKINKMKMKIAMQSETQKKQVVDKEDCDDNIPVPEKRVYTENIPQYNQITSLLTDRNTKASLMNRSNQIKNNIRFGNLKSPLIDAYKKQCINRDKQKYPLKYKIIREEIGFLNDKKVYNLRSDQVDRIKQHLRRRKGLEYLREGINAGVHIQNKKNDSNSIKKGRATSLKFAKPNMTSKIDEIFHKSIEKPKKIKSQKNLKQKMNRIQLQELKKHQQILGKLVFQKIKNHLKQQKVDPNYFRRVYTEENIDDALVNYLRVKIERAQASLGK